MLFGTAWGDRMAELTARSLGMVSCPSCHLVCRTEMKAGHPASCPRCHAALHSRKPNSINRAWALTIAAAILYLPANLLPMTRTAALGMVQEDTIMSGVIYFVQSGMWPIALVIFVASVFVPLLKILILVLLLVSVQLRWQWRPLDRTRMYRLIEFIGRWSMIDVFVVTVLVALVKLGMVADIEAGKAAVYFAAVVILTMFAAESFDPRLIWDEMEDEDE